MTSSFITIFGAGQCSTHLPPSLSHNYFQYDKSFRYDIGLLVMGLCKLDASSGVISDLGSANERRRYYVTPSLIGRAHTQNDPCKSRASAMDLYIYISDHPCSITTNIQVCCRKWPHNISIGHVTLVAIIGKYNLGTLSCSAAHLTGPFYNRNMQVITNHVALGKNAA